MKIAKNINQKLKHIPTNNRVYCYDATIIIEFLNRTFMPLPYFVKLEHLSKIGSGVQVEKSMLKNPELFDESFVSVGDMYDFYMMFRQSVDYTTEVETRWKFGLILKKLLYPKNGWQFIVKRVGRAQLWYAGPTMLRVKAPAVDRVTFPIGKTNVLAGQVEASLDDVSVEEVRDVFQNGMSTHYVQGVDEGQEGSDKTAIVTLKAQDDGIVNVVDVEFKDPTLS